MFTISNNYNWTNILPVLPLGTCTPLMGIIHHAGQIAGLGYIKLSLYIKTNYYIPKVWCGRGKFIVNNKFSN